MQGLEEQLSLVFSWSTRTSLNLLKAQPLEALRDVLPAVSSWPSGTLSLGGK